MKARAAVPFGCALAAVCILTTLWVIVTQPTPPAIPPGSSGLILSTERLQHHVTWLTQYCSPRDGEHPENMERAAAYIRRELEGGGAAVSDQAFPAAGATFRNVIGSFGPQTRDLVIVGAHYDAAGGFPGADDNASGVAALLEVAPLLRNRALTRRVELVAYALEEAPFFGTHQMGSVVHAARLHARGVRVRAMISLEMIGFFSDEPASQRFPFAALKAFYPGTGNFIVVAGRLRDAGLTRRVKRSMRRASDLPVYSINAPRSLPGMDLSDHASYWDRGDSAVMVTDSAFYRNPNYHTAADTPDTLDFARMTKVVEGVARAVEDLARP